MPCALFSFLSHRAQSCAGTNTVTTSRGEGWISVLCPEVVKQRHSPCWEMKKNLKPCQPLPQLFLFTVRETILKSNFSHFSRKLEICCLKVLNVSQAQSPETQEQQTERDGVRGEIKQLGSQDVGSGEKSLFFAQYSLFLAAGIPASRY